LRLIILISGLLSNISNGSLSECNVVRYPPATIIFGAISRHTTTYTTAGCCESENRWLYTSKYLGVIYLNKSNFSSTSTVASLYAELKQYRDIICVSCKQKVLLSASLTTASPQQSSTAAPTPSRETHTTLGNLPEPIPTIVASSHPGSPFPSSAMGSEPSSPLVLSSHSHVSTSIIEGSQTESDASFHTASQSDPDPSNATPDSLPLPTSMATVDYNPGMKRTLDLSVVEIFTFTAEVCSVRFSRDGNYFAVAIDNEETHIYDMRTKSKT
jgi:hypothetical protein